MAKRKRNAKIWPSQPRDWLMAIIGAVIAVVVIGATMYMNRNANVPLEPQTPTVDSPWIPQTVRRWETTIEEMADKYNVDPTAIAILMTMESGGYAKAESEAGAQGLMQIMPATANDIAHKFLQKPVDNFNLLDPRTNIEFGAAYMAHLRDVFGDDTQGPSWNYTMELVAAGYNGGPGAASKLYHGKGLTDTETVVYSRDALNMWRERKQQTSPTFDRWKERGGSDLLDKAKE